MAVRKKRSTTKKKATSARQARRDRKAETELQSLPPAEQEAIDQGKMISAAAAAEAFNVPERSLLTALQERKCAGVNFGGRRGWQVRPLSVLAWIEKLEKARA